MYKSTTTSTAVLAINILSYTCVQRNELIFFKQKILCNISFDSLNIFRSANQIHVQNTHKISIIIWKLKLWWSQVFSNVYGSLNFKKNCTVIWALRTGSGTHLIFLVDRAINHLRVYKVSVYYWKMDNESIFKKFVYSHIKLNWHMFTWFVLPYPYGIYTWFEVSYCIA